MGFEDWGEIEFERGNLPTYRDDFINPSQEPDYITDGQGESNLEVTNYLLPIFENSQEEKCTEEQIGTEAIRHFGKNFPLVFPESTGEHLNTLNNRINWTHELSIEKLREGREEGRATAFNHLRPDNRITRILRDQVGNRLERKREVITTYIHQYLTGSSTRHPENKTFTSYGQLLSHMEEEYATRLTLIKSHMTRAEKHHQDPGNDISLFDIPKIKRSKKSLLENYAYLRQCFRTERNFVERMIK